MLAGSEENVGGRWFCRRVGASRPSWWEKPELALATGVDLPALPFQNFDWHDLPPDHLAPHNLPPDHLAPRHHKQQTDMMLIRIAAPCPHLDLILILVNLKCDPDLILILILRCDPG